MADSVNNFVQKLGIDYKSVKKLDVENEINPEIAAKYAALKNHGNELVIKNENSYYLVELKDSVKLNDLMYKVPRDSKSIIAINFTENKGAGALFTPETLGGSTLYDKAKTIITSKRTDDTKGFRIGDGYFKAELTDINGFSNKSKNDINLKVSGKLKITTDDLTGYLNREFLSGDSKLNLLVKENGIDWKLFFKLKPEAKQDLILKTKELLAGEEGSLRDKLGKKVNLDEKVVNISNKLINGVEKRLGFGLSKDRITTILTGVTDAKKEVPKLFKEGGTKEYIEKLLKEEAGIYEEFIPDAAFSKIAALIEKKISKYIADNYNDQSINDSKLFINDLKETLGYSLSDTELEKLTTFAKSNIKGNELEINLFIKGEISSDNSIPAYNDKKDSIKVQGTFDLTSKGKAEVIKTVFNADADIDTSRINQATIVSLAESLGNKGEKLNTELVDNKRKINILGDGEFSNINEGQYHSFLNIQNFKEDNFGTNIKSIKGYFDVDLNTAGQLKMKSIGQVTVEQAALLSDFKISRDETVEKFILKKPADTKESVSIDRLNMVINNDSATLHTEGISTGVEFKIKKYKKDISLDIKKVELKNADFKLNFPEDKKVLLDAAGNNLKLTGIKVVSGKDLLQIEKISVLKGKGKVELGKSGEFYAEGSGVKLDNIKVLGLTASVTTEGLSSIRSSKESLHISGPVFKGKIKYKNDSVEFVCDKGNLDISPSGNILTYKAGADEDGAFTLKSLSRDISAKLILPRGSKAEADLKNNTLKITGKDGKEIDARIKITSFTGNPIGDFRVTSKEAVNTTLGKSLEIKTNSTVNVSGSFKAKDEDIRFNGKFHGKIKYDNNNLTYSTRTGTPEIVEFEANGKKYNLEASNQAVLSVDFPDGNAPFRLKVGEAGAPVNLNLKVSDSETGKLNAELETILLNKAELGVTRTKDGYAESLSLSITPPSADKSSGTPGISLKGTINTPDGTININQVNISGVKDSRDFTKNSNMTISEKGLNFSDSELNVEGSVSLQRNGEKSRNITFNGNTSVKSGAVDFSDKSFVVSSASFTGKINNLDVKVEGGLDGKKKEATYTAAVSTGNETLRMNGKVALNEYNKDILKVSGRTSISLKEGNLKPLYFIAGLKDLTVYKTDPIKIISGNIDINTAKVEVNKIFADKNLAFSGYFKLDKTEKGYTFSLSNADLSSRDSLKTVVGQLSAVLKQPHISAELINRGIKPSDIDILQKELYNKLISENLKTTSDIKVELNNDFQVRELNFNTRIDSIGINFPILRHTKEKGFSIEAKAGEMNYQLNEPLEISGKFTEGSNGNSLKAKLNINLNEILPKLIEQQFNSPDSPFKGKLNITLDGDKIKISDSKNNFFSSISFGLKDIDVKVRDNKAEIAIKVEFLRLLFDGVKFALSDNVKIKREWETISKAIGPTPHFKLKDLLNANKVTINLPETIKKNTPFELDGDVILKDGLLEIPFKN